MIRGLDHVALIVRDLDAASAGYQAMLGRAPNWVGADGGVRQAWFQLPNMALDVISPEGDGAFADGLRAHLDARGEGIWGLAFLVGDTVDDLAPFARLMGRRGLRAGEPVLARTTNAEGARRYWLTSSLDPADTGGLHILLTAPPRDGTPWPLSEPVGEAPVASLDHVVVQTPNVDRALGIYGAKLGLDLRLDRANEKWGARQLFFRCGDAVVEMGAKIGAEPSAKPDRFGGLAWRVADPHAAQARMAAAGLDVSEVRTGRKPGTHVFTVRDAPGGVPTLMIQPSPAVESA